MQFSTCIIISDVDRVIRDLEYIYKQASSYTVLRVRERKWAAILPDQILIVAQLIKIYSTKILLPMLTPTFQNSFGWCTNQAQTYIVKNDLLVSSYSASDFQLILACLEILFNDNKKTSRNIHLVVYNSQKIWWTTHHLGWKEVLRHI